MTAFNYFFQTFGSAKKCCVGAIRMFYIIDFDFNYGQKTMNRKLWPLLALTCYNK